MLQMIKVHALHRISLKKNGEDIEQAKNQEYSHPFGTYDRQNRSIDLIKVTRLPDYTHRFVMTKFVFIIVNIMSGKI